VDKTFDEAGVELTLISRGIIQKDVQTWASEFGGTITLISELKKNILSADFVDFAD
jgi:hypothetical protein